MAYLAPNPLLRKHSTDIRVSEECTTISFTPETWPSSAASASTASTALHPGAGAPPARRHESLAHPRRIL